MRKAEINRLTAETDISADLNLDGEGWFEGSTGVEFFDHMLKAMCVHGKLNLELSAAGDLGVDCHHTIEDTGIVLGKAVAEALGSKLGIERFGSSYVPMDEALAFVALDISGRPYLQFEGEFESPMVGSFDTQMVEEFLRAFAFNSGITLHARILTGRNDHHKIEALFKALGRALKQAVAVTGSSMPSSKGVL